MTSHPIFPLRVLLLVPLLLLAGRPHLAQATCTDEDGVVWSANDTLTTTTCEDCDTIHLMERKCLSSGEWEHVADETDGCPWEDGTPFCKPVNNTFAVCQEDPVESESTESTASEDGNATGSSTDGNTTGTRGFSSLVSSAGRPRHSAGAAAGTVTAVLVVIAAQLLAW